MESFIFPWEGRNVNFLCFACGKSAVQLLQCVLGPGLGGLSRSPAPWELGCLSPTAPLISLHKIEKADDKAVQEALFWFPCCHLRQFLSFFFSLPDNESRTLPHVFKSMQNVKSLLVWLSEIFWISARDINSAISCCCCFCVAVSSGGDVYFCNNIDIL